MEFFNILIKIPGLGKDYIFRGETGQQQSGYTPSCFSRKACWGHLQSGTRPAWLVSCSDSIPLELEDVRLPSAANLEAVHASRGRRFELLPYLPKNQILLSLWLFWGAVVLGPIPHSWVCKTKPREFHFFLRVFSSALPKHWKAHSRSIGVQYVGYWKVGQPLSGKHGIQLSN